jgi:beta-aspartyl-peptidase (threonine type)
MTPEKEAQYRAGIEEAINDGYQVLDKGGSALDAVEAAVRGLEDNPLFNAGRGAVYNHQGSHELDAAIMDGHSLHAGAVACVRFVRNPVSLARAVMVHSNHVLLSGLGAESFALEMKMQLEPESYFATSERYGQWVQLRDTEQVALDHTVKKFGTVGAIALDRQGNLAAATSTGGMTNKRYHRIGDTPLIGAGTYANNQTCAISCTGHGEYFIRSVAAYDVSCLMEYRGMNLQQACETVVMEKLLPLGGEGGLIGLDRQGNISLVFNSEGMYRGSHKEGEAVYTAIYRD